MKLFLHNSLCAMPWPMAWAWPCPWPMPMLAIMITHLSVSKLHIALPLGYALHSPSPQGISGYYNNKLCPQIKIRDLQSCDVTALRIRAHHYSQCQSSDGTALPIRETLPVFTGQVGKGVYKL